MTKKTENCFSYAICFLSPLPPLLYNWYSILDKSQCLVRLRAKLILNTWHEGAFQFLSFWAYFLYRSTIVYHTLLRWTGEKRLKKSIKKRIFRSLNDSLAFSGTNRKQGIHAHVQVDLSFGHGSWSKKIQLLELDMFKLSHVRVTSMYSDSIMPLRYFVDHNIILYW